MDPVRANVSNPEAYFYYDDHHPYDRTGHW